MIKVENLIKTFGPKRAVDGVSFAVERGEVLGFLGPNGAGKSTSMRMITGFIPPTSGTVMVVVSTWLITRSGQTLDWLSAGKCSGLLDMTVNGFLGFVAELRGLRGDDKKRAVGRAVEMCSWIRSCIRASTRFPRVSSPHLFRPIHHP